MIHCGMCSVYERILRHLQRREGLSRSSVGFVHEGSDVLEGKGNGGFCKIIWPNFMYLTSGKLLQ